MRKPDQQKDNDKDNDNDKYVHLMNKEGLLRILKTFREHPQMTILEKLC